MKLTAVSAEALIDHWRTSELSPGRQLSATSQKVYASIFTGFCRYLPCHWSEASVEQVVAYCTQLRPKTSASRPSAVSVTRYYRVIEDFFNVAAGLALEGDPDWVNPILNHRRPPEIGYRNKVESTLLHAGHLARLRASCTPSSDWLEARNAAIICTLLDCALTRSELEQLTVRSYAAPRLRIEGVRPAQARSLELSEQGASLLTAYIALRSERAPDTDALFINERGGAASSQVIFNAVANAIDAAVKGCGDKAPHHGPNVLRNSVIKAWLDAGTPTLLVAARAGVFRESSLRRLIKS